MKTILKTALWLLFSLSLLSLPALAQATIPGCTLGGTGIQGSLSRITGLCNEFFATDKIVWYIVLPFVAFTFIIWGVLEEIGLFRTKPQVHTALALLLSAMILPTGAFGKVAIMIFTGGAMLLIISVGLVFLLGVNFWVQKKTREYAYAGIWSGWAGRMITIATFGFVGFFIGRMMGWSDWGAAFIAAGVGFVWSMFSKSVRSMLGTDEMKLIDKEIQRNVKLLGTLSQEQQRFQTQLAGLAAGTPAYIQVENQLTRISREITTVEARIAELERKSRGTFDKI